jgi:hypothetical protein
MSFNLLTELSVFGLTLYTIFTLFM